MVGGELLQLDGPEHRENVTIKVLAVPLGRSRRPLARGNRRVQAREVLVRSLSERHLRGRHDLPSPELAQEIVALGLCVRPCQCAERPDPPPAGHVREADLELAVRRTLVEVRAVRTRRRVLRSICVKGVPP